MDSTGSTSQTAPAVIGRKWAWWIMLVLCLAGLVLSVLLAQIHYKANTQPDFHSFCGRGSTFNCDSVARSAYSVLLGVPMAWWGLIGYAVAAGLVVALTARGLRSWRTAAAVLLTLKKAMAAWSCSAWLASSSAVVAISSEAAEFCWMT